MVRIDHFRGFAGYYAVRPESKNAVHGHWRKGPGADFVDAVKKEMPHLSVIAEDLGFLTDDVRELLAESGFPGMKVLQFAFDSREKSDYLPHNYGKNCVVYTGTHDNITTKGLDAHCAEGRRRFRAAVSRHRPGGTTLSAR